MNASRRQFFRATAAIAACSAPFSSRFSLPLASTLSAIGALASQSSSAADVSGGYKALVCVFLNGGSDMHNWVVPFDASGYSEYSNVRRGLAWPTSRLQQIASTNLGAGRSFAMPTEMSAMHALYDASQLAVLANVGTLDSPISKADFMAGRNLPSKLFSHNDQQSTWQSLLPEGARSGWGGRMGDILMSANQRPVFTAISASGNAVFLNGEAVTQFQVAASGPVSVPLLDATSVFGSTAAADSLRTVLASSGDNGWTAEYTKVMQRALATSAELGAAIVRTSVAELPSAPIALPAGGSIVMSSDALARQLRVVAQIIAAAPGLGMRRQVFMVSMGGFDTHAKQMRDQPALMARVSNAIGWFTSAMQASGNANNVTLFTASDFGRTLATNGAGSDHGWGSHHFIAGGAVRGGSIYGRFPITAIGTADEIGSGRLLPSTSVTEYAGTLASWMGLSQADIQTVLPNVGQFSNTAMGFV